MRHDRLYDEADIVTAPAGYEYTKQGIAASRKTLRHITTTSGHEDGDEAPSMTTIWGKALDQ